MASAQEVLGRGSGQIALVGEAPGPNETIYKRPFVGEAGQELSRMLVDANLPPLSTGHGKDLRYNYYVTNTFKNQPDDSILEFFVPRTDPLACTKLPPYRPGKYLRSDLEAQVRSLVNELVGSGATVVIALGATALWALLGFQKISSYVGTVHRPAAGRPFTVIPTYHPNAVLRQWSYRTQVVANLLKVHDVLGQRLPSSAGTPLPGVDFNIKINPTISEVERFAQRACNAPLMAVDVETAAGQIRTISFSLGPREAFVIPFWEPPAPSYWSDLETEVRAWKAVAWALAGPGTKVFHNGSYDIQYIWRVHGIPIRGNIEDTILAHHSLELELPKSLGGLAATYLALPEWKTSRVKSEKDQGDEE